MADREQPPGGSDGIFEADQDRASLAALPASERPPLIAGRRGLLSTVASMLSAARDLTS